MNFKEILLEILLEGKIEDTLDRHPTIPHDVKQNYLKQVPANNTQHLDWVLSQHTKGNINPVHNIHGILSTFNKVKDKLPKKQISQYKSMDELHAAIVPHADTVKKSVNEKSSEGTQELYNSPTMTIRQHHNYESSISAANLPNSNPHKGKAGWCVSVGDGGGASHHSKYTDNGFHPVYTIERQHEDGTSSRHMLVYDHNKTQDQQELRNEADHRPGFSDYNSTRPDLLDHYGKENPELLKTPIAHLFSEAGREEYKKEAEPEHQKLKEILKNIPKNGMSDEEYMSNFKAGQQHRQGGIHNALADVDLSHTQLTHLIEHGNDGSKGNIAANRTDLSEEHMQKLANTSNMAVHHHLLSNDDITDSVFNTIVKKVHPEGIKGVIGHPKFNETHIDTVLNKSGSDANLMPIVQRLHDKLEPHHISAIIDKGDTHTKLLLATKHYDKLKPEHINALMDKGDDITQYALRTKMNIPHDPHFISNLIDKGDTKAHNLFLNNFSHDLKPEHIDKLIDKGDASVHSNLLYNFPHHIKTEHISTLANNGDADSHKILINNFSHNLKSEHISALIDKGDDTTKLLLATNHYDKLEPHHIKALLDKGGDVAQYALKAKMNMPQDPHQISRIIDSGDNVIHRTLIDKSHDLKPEHITALINKGNSRTRSAVLNELTDKLEPHHITALLDKGDRFTAHAVLNKFKDKLEPEHITSLINKGSHDTRRRLGDELPQKLEPHHITALINKDVNLNNAYTKLSPESKKVVVDHVQTLKYTNHPDLSTYNNVHKDIHKPLSEQFSKEMNEWHFGNSNFEQLLKESLISK